MTTREQAPVELGARIDALQSTVAALEKQINRAGREQLKANALAETQAERLAAALDALRAAEQRHEAERVAAQDKNRVAATEARLELVRAILPALDGLDEAIRAGGATLEHHAPREAPDALLRRLLNAAPSPAEPAAPAALLGAMRAWLEGLTMVRRRLLDALAAAGVTPIAAAGQPFDPRRHLVIEVVSTAAPAGTVVHEIRRGFVAGERVLRHAEVAVAGGPQSKE